MFDQTKETMLKKKGLVDLEKNMTKEKEKRMEMYQENLKMIFIDIFKNISQSIYL